jgi:hypothetical protein
MQKYEQEEDRVWEKKKEDRERLYREDTATKPERSLSTSTKRTTFFPF